jgi:myo-inositol-1(or 4)-monophosphatase
MSKELEIAIQAAQDAGAILKNGWKEDLVVSFKADKSIVTQIDSSSESAIIEIIKKNFPTHQIIAEESGDNHIESDHVWYIDPLDGTTNYSRKVPICAVVISLIKNGQPHVGVIYNPFTEELFAAEAGLGATLNGIKLVTSTLTDLSQAMVGLSYGHSLDARELVVAKSLFVTETRTKREYGSVAYELALLASGRFDGYLSAGHNPWDQLAGILMIQEAGGVVTDLSGQDPQVGGQYLLAAANKQLHQKLMALLH